MSGVQPCAWDPPDLSGTVAVVTGASRGVGRGIAASLGDAGATVYVTGRSTDGKPTTGGLPGTIDQTARLVTARGGVGIAVRCDQSIDADVERLVSTILDASGPPDLVVNNAWPGYERTAGPRFDAPFWKQPQQRWDDYFGSLRGSYLLARLVAPHMAESERGLIVNLSYTDGDIYLGQVAYDVVKHAADRLALGMGADLRKHGVVAVTLHPGFVRTERVELAGDRLGEGPAAAAHSPEYVGRAIAELAGADDLAALSGQILRVGDLAGRFGFTDVDGTRPPPFRLEGSLSLARRMETLLRAADRATTSTNEVPEDQR